MEVTGRCCGLNFIRSMYACVVFVFVLVPALACSGSAPTETALRGCLFAPSYDPLSRPVEDPRDNVSVFVDLALNQIVDMKEKLQVLQTQVWVRLKWRDPQLTWNLTDYPHISHVFVTSERVWTPDIVIYNEVGLEMGREPRDFLVSIAHDGWVTWNFPRTVETSCKMDVMRFPFDSQRCHFQFGSWSMSGNMMDIYNRSDKGDITAFVDNGEWILRDITARRNVQFYGCCTDPYPDVTFTILIERRHLYYVFNLILPCIIITLLDLTSFLLPAESGEKISLNVTILLGLTVYLLIVAEIMPPQSEVVPIVGRYFGASIFLVSISTAISVLILHLHFRGSRGFPVPPLLRSAIIGKLGYFLCYGSLIDNTELIQYENHVEDKKPAPQAVKTTKLNLKFANEPAEEEVNGNVESLQKVRVENDIRARANIYSRDHYVIASEGRAPMDDLGVLHRRIEDKEAEEKAMIQDWILVALILDRLFFIMLALAQIGAFIYVLSPMFSTTES